MEQKCKDLDFKLFYLQFNVLCIFQKLEQIVILAIDEVVIHQSCHWNQIILLCLQRWICNEIIMNVKNMIDINFLYNIHDNYYFIFRFQNLPFMQYIELKY